MTDEEDPRREFDDVVLRAVLFAARPVTVAEIVERVGGPVERVESALRRLERARRIIAQGDRWTSR